ncbi:MAG TPA: hypothetical protein VEX68_29650 [Bryobacteraceae bacterium]|nr:hypothetical protein [Bryobacteraceae bacterium]
MSKTSLYHLISVYRKTLIDAGVRPQVVDVTQNLTREEMLSHCLWVLDEKVNPLLHRIGGFQEALRLLGSIQGTVMACGLCTIAETLEHANAANLTTWGRIVD